MKVAYIILRDQLKIAELHIDIANDIYIIYHDGKELWRGKSPYFTDNAIGKDWAAIYRNYLSFCKVAYPYSTIYLLYAYEEAMKVRKPPYIIPMRHWLDAVSHTELVADFDVEWQGKILTVSEYFSRIINS